MGLRRMRGARRSARRTSFEFSSLEQRVLLSTLPGHDPASTGMPDLEITPVPPEIMAATADTTSTGTVAMAGVPLSSVPVLHSDPSATAKLYLDFAGDTTATWGSYSPGTTPAYDTDGDATTFSTTELANIQQIWARVAEKYSPFNIDVTTQNPGNLTDRMTQEMVIGGKGAWLGSQAGGVSYVGSFYNSAMNKSFIFPANLGSGNPKYTAEATAHEAGHAFGLLHQSTWSGTTKTAEYNPGNSLVAPIMGNSYSAARGLWFKGTASDSSTDIQDDMSILSGSNDGFGYRAQDHGQSIAAANPFAVSGTTVSGSGIVETTADNDYFSFATGAGQVTLTASPAQYGAMLDLKLVLLNGNGTVVASADTSSLGETITTTLAAGTYYVDVASHGSYGDVGQYSVSGTIVSPGTGGGTGTVTVAAPTSLAAKAVSTTQVNLTWADNATNETGYIVQRSTNGGSTWSNLATLGANATSYTDATGSAGATYSYRVYATNASANSAYSNVATVTTIPAAPVNLAASAASASQINLSWTDVAGETGYRIDRSTDGTNWTTIANVGANVTGFQNTALTANTLYYYRVFATNGSGTSAASSTVSARTLTATTTGIPAAPSNFNAVSTSSTTASITWQDNSTNETGFRVEYSYNNSTWYTLGNVGANVTAATVSGLATGTTYYFRVRSYNSAGTSAPSNSDWVQPPYYAPTSASSVTQPQPTPTIWDRFFRTRRPRLA